VAVPAAVRTTDRTFAGADVAWSIRIRHGFSELDDPAAHHGVRQHAYLLGCDSTPVCGERPALADRVLGRASRLGPPSPMHNPRCHVCLRLVRRDELPSPFLGMWAASAAGTPSAAEVAPHTSFALTVVQHPTMPVGPLPTSVTPASRVRLPQPVLADRPEPVIRMDLLAAPDYRGRASWPEPPPQMGRCEFRASGSRCSKSGRWHRHGWLACTSHATARDPRPWTAGDRAAAA
jgi:hypothetical protein